MAITFSLLLERLVLKEAFLVGNGKRNNQAVLIVGGSGSGKDYALDHIYWANRHSFKRISSDETLERTPKTPSFEQNANLLMKEIELVLTHQKENHRMLNWIHSVIPSAFFSEKELLQYVKVDLKKEFALNQKQKNAALLSLSDKRNVAFMRLFGAIHRNAKKRYYKILEAQKNKKEKDNLAFETIGEYNVLIEYCFDLLAAGYQKENIHIIWVLTQVDTAIMNNLKRKEKGGRSVAPYVIDKTHRSAKQGMSDLFELPYAKLRRMFDGEFWVVLNDTHYTQAVTQLNQHTENYLCIKKPSKPFWEGIETRSHTKDLSRFSKSALLNH